MEDGQRALPLGRAVDPALPHLRHSDGGIQLMANGQPFLMLAGELHNSSLTSARFMSEVWPAMKADSINTLLGAVYWETIEPVEGRFDFSELDDVILGARAHGMRLVLLWFGTYKNGVSTYAPPWVKRDVRRFPRVYVNDEAAPDGRRAIEMVTPLCDEACRADSRAFEALMRHLVNFDAQHSTVLMVQVHNETGLLGDSRDRSRRAEKAFAEPVPVGLLRYLTNSGGDNKLHPAFTERFSQRLPAADEIETRPYSWTDVFGPADADEAFMAHHISRFVGRVAAAGKAANQIPIYTNTWLSLSDPSELELEGVPVSLPPPEQCGAGFYPSGGPCPHVCDIWRHNAPALDFLAPDLYVHDYDKTCREYAAIGGGGQNALFIPEQRRDPHGARRLYVAYATHGALGAAPFGIDTGPADVGREYALLARTRRYLMAARPEQRFGFYFDEMRDDDDTGKPVPPAKGREQWTRAFCGGKLEVIVERAFVFGRPGPGAGMVIQLGDDPETSTRFLAVGRGFNVRFRCTDKVVPRATFCGILRAEEKEAVRVGRRTAAEEGDGEEEWELRTLRTLNGDETRSGEFLIMPNDDPDYGGFPIAVTVPARTCIAEVEAYWVCEEDEEEEEDDDDDDDDDE